MHPAYIEFEVSFQTRASSNGIGKQYSVLLAMGKPAKTAVSPCSLPLGTFRQGGICAGETFRQGEICAGGTFRQEGNLCRRNVSPGEEFV